MAFNKVQNATTQIFERTLTYDLHTDPEVLKQEQEKIFSKSWQLVGHVSQLEKIGDFFTADVAGEPILVTRDKNETIQAFYNVCPHRATIRKK